MMSTIPAGPNSKMLAMRIEPLISVVIPVYNAERFIEEAVESVFAQGHPHIEVIVVNDGSTDATAARLAGFGNKIKVIEQENKGQAVARNRGLAVARGEFIGLLDADDMWTPDHVSSLLPLLTNSPEVMAARGQVRYVRFDGGEVSKETPPLFLEALVGACLYRAELFDRIGNFDETMRSGEDFDWHIRFSESGLEEKRVEKVTLLYRRHENNLTNSREFISSGQIASFRRKLERARARNDRSHE